MLAHYSTVTLLGSDSEPPINVGKVPPSPLANMTQRTGSVSEYSAPVSTSTALSKRDSNGSCEHLTKLRRARGADYLLEQYSIIVQHFVACCSAPDRRRRAYSAVCGVCRERTRLHVCLLCVHLACHSPTRSHILAHSASADHQMAVELSYGQVLCTSCNDYVYDSSFGAILQQFNNRARLDLGLPAQTVLWEPTEDEIELLKHHPKRRKLSSHLTIGLRGLLNLGSTCFMNSILQALVHTPFIRDYFLGEQHRCTPDTAPSCLGCEVAATFREFYSGMQRPYIPYRLLHLVWKHAKHLAGYEQQDAHEFFISLLDILHTHLTRTVDPAKSSSTAAGNNAQSSAQSDCKIASTPQCPCIIHKVFTGYLQSDVTCHKCNSARTTIDPFWDISLDLHHTPTSANSPSHGDGGDGLSLKDCIQRFTKPEKLTGAKIECTVCRTFEEDLWSKQLTFKQLPLVVCFHLKRFHGNANGSHRKISDAVSFPTDLDLTPFTTVSAAASSNNNNSLKSSDNHSNNNNTNTNSQSESESSNLIGSSLGSSTTPMTNSKPETPMTPAAAALYHDSNSYALFAVVSHAGGQIDNGHYVAYVRQNKDWFKCDDHLVTPVRVADVLAAEGYLLFYHKKFVDYELGGNIRI